MRILAIDTSCDDTTAAVTRNVQVTSNIIWSQASLYAKFGGVVPSLAQRAHEERIEWVVNKSLTIKHKSLASDIDAIAVTVGPGLSIALGVGINYARELSLKYKKPLIPINHIEAHLLSPFATPSTIHHTPTNFPTYGLVLSGGTTLLCLVKDIGKYEVLAETSDDALGEALDKAARLLGFGYPGAAVLEKFAREGSPDRFKLPIPLISDKIKNRFSYSGLKTAFVRLYESVKDPTRQDICDLAASFQNAAFEHIIRVLDYQINHQSLVINHLLFGGGVSNNIELRKRLRRLCKACGVSFHLPYSKKLTGDNAAMIGVTAYLKLKTENLKLEDFMDYSKVDRNPKLNLQ